MSIETAEGQTAEEQALASALRRHASEIATVITDRPLLHALESAKWHAKADSRNSLVDAAIDSTRHRLGDASPLSACADEWLAHIANDVIENPTEDQLSKLHDIVHQRRGRLRSILEACRPQVEALACARLTDRTRPKAYTDVLERLKQLAAALGEDHGEWRVPLVRLPPLGALDSSTWRELERAPAWAVVLALGEPRALDTDYCCDIESLVQSPAHWATPHIAEAARISNISLTHDVDPKHIEPLLASWPWPNAQPPLSIIGACADTRRVALTHDEWAYAVSLAYIDEMEMSLNADDVVATIDQRAPRLRTKFEEEIEDQALRYLAEWLGERRKQPPSDADCKAALDHMRALWAADPLLAPATPDDHNLRIEPMEPEERGAKDESNALYWNLPTSLQYAIRRSRGIAWRVPFTSPERAIAASEDISKLATEVANHASLTSPVRSATHHGLFNMMISHRRRADCDAVPRRIAAVEAILDRIAADG